MWGLLGSFDQCAHELHIRRRLHIDYGSHMLSQSSLVGELFFVFSPLSHIYQHVTDSLWSHFDCYCDSKWCCICLISIAPYIFPGCSHTFTSLDSVIPTLCFTYVPVSICKWFFLRTFMYSTYFIQFRLFFSLDIPVHSPLPIYIIYDFLERNNHI